MNMKGGYDVQEYEALIEERMDSQVIPLIEIRGHLPRHVQHAAAHPELHRDLHSHRHLYCFCGDADPAHEGEKEKVKKTDLFQMTGRFFLDFIYE